MNTIHKDIINLFQYYQLLHNSETNESLEPPLKGLPVINSNLPNAFSSFLLQSNVNFKIKDSRFQDYSNEVQEFNLRPFEDNLHSINSISMSNPYLWHYM